MTILQALNEYYDRMVARGEAEELGFTRENIAYALSINADGTIRDVLDLRSNFDGKPRPRRVSVPRPKRTSNIQANFLWDKTAYAFGVDSGKSKRLSAEHNAFKLYHREMLAGFSDHRAKAFLSFLHLWTPERFTAPPFKNEMLDSSFVFRFEDEHLWFHEVAELRALWLATLSDPQAARATCLILGKIAPIETGHPVIKGVRDAQTSGAYLVSFNEAAYTSYNKPRDASNAQISKAAAARYGAALNGLLERSSRNRLAHPIGDSTVLFWADTSAANESAAKAAEELFAGWLSTTAERVNSDNDEGAAAKLRDALVAVSEGRPIPNGGPDLSGSIRFYVVGLAAPAKARLTMRYWLESDFQAFARRLREHYDDLSIEPVPWGNDKLPAVWRLLLEATTSKKAAGHDRFKNVLPLLASETVRAVLGGGNYPRMLLTTALLRLRAGDDPRGGWHAAVLKACINRAHRIAHPRTKEPLTVSLDPNNPSPAYQLGRLFAVLESAQYAALGRVNAPISDRYYGSASATPARVFGTLMRGARIHISDARKRGRGLWIEPRLNEIIGRLGPDLPRSLLVEDQARFAVGYYHERGFRFAKAEIDGAETTDHTGTNAEEASS